MTERGKTKPSKASQIHIHSWRSLPSTMPSQQPSKAQKERDARRSQIAYEVEQSVREKLGPMKPIRRAA